MRIYFGHILLYRTISRALQIADYIGRNSQIRHAELLNRPSILAVVHQQGLGLRGWSALAGPTAVQCDTKF